MSGIIGLSPDMRSGVVGAFPTGQIIYTDSVEFTSTEASVAITSGYSTSSDLVISVPAETVAKCSKIWIAASNNSHGNANIRSADWFSYWNWEIYRTAPTTGVIASWERVGLGIDEAGVTGSSGLAQGTISGWDKSLSNAIHTYAMRFSKLNQGNVYGGNYFVMHGDSGSKVNISVFGVSK